jgi:hypothetical protein
MAKNATEKTGIKVIVVGAGKWQQKQQALDSIHFVSSASRYSARSSYKRGPPGMTLDTSCLIVLIYVI